MANPTPRQNPAINLREEGKQPVRDFYMPAMPPVGFARSLSQWIRERRRARRAAPVTRLNGYLLNDLGVNTSRTPRINERQLTTIYSQPLGPVSMTIRRGQPAEFHAVRRRS